MKTVYLPFDFTEFSFLVVPDNDDLDELLGQKAII